MSQTIKQIEAVPASYPNVPDGLSSAAAALDPKVIWQRIEAHTAFRSSERTVIWVVEGCGEWCPPLYPATIQTVEVWSRAGEWETVEIPASPLGYYLPASGPYRFTGIVGDNDAAVPASIAEAFRRIAEYSVQKIALAGVAGATSETISVGGISLAYRRSPSWLALAMQNSGAADLLRPYRRLA